MKSIPLAQTGRQTTRLGFGCSSLMGANTRKESLALLESAFDAGIRHFDVAPMYGYGAAEGLLGEFLAVHPGAVTVTTKYGILPPPNQSLLGLGRKLAGPIVKRLPGIKQRLARAAGSVSGPIARASFTPAQASESLDRSLRALRTEHIDVWLLHEAEWTDLEDDRLLKFLESSVAAGKIGTFGVGSDQHKIPALLAGAPRYCRVLQYEWSVVDPAIDLGDEFGSAFRSHHRSLTDNFRELHSDLLVDPARRRQWSEATGTDLHRAENLAALMLKAALVFNPDSIILFSSKKPAHIQHNVEVAGDASLEAPARRLYELVQANG
jgi:aryl-alcohol dehydrogenase-like predicted oxidoreductase